MTFLWISRCGTQYLFMEDEDDIVNSGLNFRTKGLGAISRCLPSLGIEVRIRGHWQVFMLASLVLHHVHKWALKGEDEGPKLGTMTAWGQHALCCILSQRGSQQVT